MNEYHITFSKPEYDTPNLDFTKFGLQPTYTVTVTNVSFISVPAQECWNEWRRMYRGEGKWATINL